MDWLRQNRPAGAAVLAAGRDELAGGRLALGPAATSLLLAGSQDRAFVEAFLRRQRGTAVAPVELVGGDGSLIGPSYRFGPGGPWIGQGGHQKRPGRSAGALLVRGLPLGRGRALCAGALGRLLQS